MRVNLDWLNEWAEVGDDLPGRVERSLQVAAGRPVVVHLERVERGGEPLHDVVVDLQGRAAT